MPQISLRISRNVDVTRIDFQNIFAAIHDELPKLPDISIHACNSGVIQEIYSYIGNGDNRVAKVYLEICWLEDNKRTVAVKKELAKALRAVLENLLLPHIEKQGLTCVPRIRIASLGVVDEDYFICKR